VETEPFSETFGPKAQRKKARLDVGTFEELSKQGAAAAEDAEQAANELELSSSGILQHIPFLSNRS
jgi:nuclear GTP-binding protein